MVVARTLFSVSAILIIIITLFVHVNAVQETGELKTESSRNTLLADYESHEHAVKEPEGIAAMVDICLCMTLSIMVIWSNVSII
ncbi:unnamed protein product [Brassica oleracea var. botrytis]